MVSEFRLIVAGGRDFNDPDLLHSSICDVERLTPEGSELIIVSGMARGADRLAWEWAKRYCVPVLEFPADWDTHGKAAGHIRNKQMADVAHGLLAFWDGESRGTKNMIETMQAMRKPVKIVMY